MASLDVDRFVERLGKIHSHFSKHRSTAAWNNASCLSLCRGPLDDSNNTYLKSVLLHQYLFGYELPDLILLLTKEGDLHVMASQKKIDFIAAASDKMDGRLHLHPRQKADDNAANWEAMQQVIASGGSVTTTGGDGDGDGDGNNNTTSSSIVIGCLVKEQSKNSDDIKSLVGQWETTHLTTATDNDDSNSNSNIQLVDCAPGLSYVMALKDAAELDLMKKSSVLSNKLM
eukprot:CAMPEP_0119030838 /NCGR_PEP_ID=MMETSP1176-20130426/41237_1 /TAXON_ID=265551 /ORGANISM="Synedropsis recta cf, Strain CCMP1620" /LENGTH=228 /DNA_ID=CAMNT_0006987215 /DNA_START=30 /DNA_END=713 /DNA_ORIENTATION=-